MSDPTDPGGVGAPSRERSARSRRVGDPGSPVASPLTIALAILAVVGAFLILNSVRDDAIAGGGDDAPPAAGGESTTPAPSPSSPVTAAPTPAPSATPTRSGAIVLVANASRLPNTAGNVTEVLRRAEYTVGDPTNASEAAYPSPLETTEVYYAAGNDAALAVATQIQTDLAIAAAPQPLPAEPPVESMGEATVLVVLGRDKVEQTIADTPNVNLPEVPAAGTAATG